MIDLGEISELHTQIILEAPAPDIYLGRKLRRPAPPTTAALRRMLATLQPVSGDRGENE